MNKKILFLFLVVALAFSATPAFAGDNEATDYINNIGTHLVRGVKNILGGPLEALKTVKEHHEGDGEIIIRHAVGVLDGMLQGAARMFSGVTDVATGFLPGDVTIFQQDPEVLF